MGRRDRAPVKPAFFPSPAEFRAWMEQHHARQNELLVGFHKVATGKPSLTWPQSVDVALCFGWIDGVRKRIDDASYSIRFTPRKAGSIWSAINTRRIGELEALGLMREAGRAAFSKRDEKKTAIYSYESRYKAVLDPEFERELRANPKAWRFFAAQLAGYRQVIIYWVMTAKREETRRRRLLRMISESAKERRFGDAFVKK